MAASISLTIHLKQSRVKSCTNDKFCAIWRKIVAKDYIFMIVWLSATHLYLKKKSGEFGVGLSMFILEC